MTMMLINNLTEHARQLQPNIARAMERVVQRGWFVLGPEVSAFEAAFAEYHGARSCVSVANGTDALELTLRAIGVGAGDRVATVANASMYTTTALFAIGAEPFYLDVDLNTQLVTEAEVERALRAGVRTLVVTHLYGRAAPIERIAARCREAGVKLIEDCAQAHGATVGGRRVGTFGDAGCFSFYPTKNLGALGDGGAVVTSDAGIAEAVKSLRQYGWTSKYTVTVRGARNSRLDELQAAILLEMLPLLDQWNQRRRDIALRYAAGIAHREVRLPEPGGDDYVAHLYVVRSARRDSLKKHLADAGIAADVHYPVADHRQPVFGDRLRDVVLANTEALCHEVLTLPCYPEMTGDDAQRVIAAVNSWPT